MASVTSARELEESLLSRAHVYLIRGAVED